MVDFERLGGLVVSASDFRSKSGSNDRVLAFYSRSQHKPLTVPFSAQVKITKLSGNNLEKC